MLSGGEFAPVVTWQENPSKKMNRVSGMRDSRNRDGVFLIARGEQWSRLFFIKESNLTLRKWYLDLTGLERFKHSQIYLITDLMILEGGDPGSIANID